MDRLVDHLFVFEGNGKVKDFNGSYAEYRALKRSVPAVLTAETLKSPAKIAGTEAGLTNTERNEMKKLEKEISALEHRKKEILERFNAADLGAEEASKLSNELGNLQKTLDGKETRWLELAERG